MTILAEAVTVASLRMKIETPAPAATVARLLQAAVEVLGPSAEVTVDLGPGLIIVEGKASA
jgi:hypothetical protein